MSKKVKSKLDLSKEVLVDMYVTQNKSAVEIETITGWSSGTIYNKMRKFGIERRSIVECQRPIKISKEYLIKNYIDLRMSIESIAKNLHCSSEVVRRKLKHYSIPARDKTCNFGGWNTGKKSPLKTKEKISDTRKKLFASGELGHWNEGKHHSEKTRKKISEGLLKGREPSPKYYGADWNIQRTSCLQRDGYKCDGCHSTENLEVHHWEPYRFSFDNSLDNLVTLCRECHIEQHNFYRREGFIREKELEYYGYYATRNEEEN